jgi:hypothetical protein
MGANQTSHVRRHVPAAEKAHGMKHESFISERTRAPSSHFGTSSSFSTDSSFEGFSYISGTDVDGLLDSQSNAGSVESESGSSVSLGSDSPDSQDNLGECIPPPGIARLLTCDSLDMDGDSDDSGDDDDDLEDLQSMRAQMDNAEDDDPARHPFTHDVWGNALSSSDASVDPRSFISGTFTSPVNSRGIPISFGPLPARRRKRDVAKAFFRRAFPCFIASPEEAM